MEKYTTNINLEALGLTTTAQVGDIEKHMDEQEYHEKRVKKVSAFRFYFINIFFGAIVMGIGLFMAAVTFCKLENIQYDGVVNSNTTEIENVLFSDKYCSNAIYAWAVNIPHNKTRISFVKDVEVYLKNRNTVVVSVMEDELYAMTKQPDGNNIYLDRNGKVCEISKKLVSNVPVIEGISYAAPQEDADLDVEGKKLDKCLEIIKYLKEKNIVIDSLILDRDQTYGFYYGNIFVDLGLSDNIRDIINRLPHILPDIEGQTGILHFEEWGQINNDIIFERM